MASTVCVRCGADAVVHWQRHPTPVELAAIIGLENERRARAEQLADPQAPLPVWPALPTAEDTLVAVYACAEHSLTLDEAALIHTAQCTAPNPDDLPGCDCTPKALPTEPETPASPPVGLPPGWYPGSA
jgi:hypothetical protein